MDILRPITSRLRRLASTFCALLCIRCAKWAQRLMNLNSEPTILTEVKSGFSVLIMPNPYEDWASMELYLTSLQTSTLESGPRSSALH